MNSIIAFALAAIFALGLGTTAVVAYSSNHAIREHPADAPLATDGAFRDGFFVGRLTAERGQAPHPPVGRWSSAKDRASFLAGYRRGYGEMPADELQPVQHD